MKHIFVFNPTAGKGNIPSSLIDEKLKGSDVDYEIYTTVSKGDTQRFVKKRIADNAEREKLRFYACGGDGTLRDVVNGCVFAKNVEVSVFPIGSGNDFVRYYGGAEAFLSLMNVNEWQSHSVDVIKIGNEYSVNITNFGFDSDACATMIKIKRKPLIGGKNSYISGVVKSVFTSMNNKGRIFVDGSLINPDGHYCLCSICNASFVGGGFCPAPMAITNDGLLDVIQFKPINFFSFAAMIGHYKDGTYTDIRKYDRYYRYLRAKKVHVEAEKDFNMCLDGEIFRGKEFDIEIIPKAVMIASPFYPEKNKKYESCEVTEQ